MRFIAGRIADSSPFRAFAGSGNSRRGVEYRRKELLLLDGLKDGEQKN